MQVKNIFPVIFFWVIHKILSTGKAWVCLKYTVQNLFVDFPVSCSSVPCRIETFLRETETYRAHRWLYIAFWFALLLINEASTWPDVRFLNQPTPPSLISHFFFLLFCWEKEGDHCLAHAFNTSLELTHMWFSPRMSLDSSVELPTVTSFSFCISLKKYWGLQTTRRIETSSMQKHIKGCMLIFNKG